jgi:2-(1,2-epoxy-1,2-dihydrophenyl)acetyl-CoA isomerase
MTYNSLLLDRVGDGVAVITLNRPDALNALNEEMHAEIDGAISELEGDGDVRAIVMTGAGDRAFCAGYDVKEQAPYDEDRMLIGYVAREPYMWHIASSRTPIVAAVNGFAWGGGAVVATGADIRVGCPRTSFKVTATAYGGVNASWSLPPIVGTATAKDWLLTAREVGAEELFAARWLNYLVPDDEVKAKALAVAGQIAANWARGTEATKELVNASVGRTMHDAQRAETVRLATDLRPMLVSNLFEKFLSKSNGGG